MLFTTIKLIKSVFSPEYKTKPIEKATEAMIEFKGEYMRHVTCVTIEHVKKVDWATGGKIQTQNLQMLKNTFYK